ncbi:unnamed protein product [Phaedon cochleariae]|uniref:C2H2-type domain-containing protein n=1 Tax=Phaedon cochleariae TaxID=80249 RepID=A0A9N9SI65_PHACE|nr:unnamed protein product [Phaedon cochleariae]
MNMLKLESSNGPQIKELPDMIESDNDNEFEDELRSKNEKGFLTQEVKVEMDIDENHWNTIKIETNSEPCQTSPCKREPLGGYPDQEFEELEDPGMIDGNVLKTETLPNDEDFTEGISDLLENDKTTKDISDIEESEQHVSQNKVESSGRMLRSQTSTRRRKDMNDSSSSKGKKLKEKVELKEKPAEDPPLCKVHYVDRHTSKCKVCGNIILNKAHLAKEDYNLKEKAFVCEICGEYVLESLLSKHQKLHPITHFDCAFCEETFTFKSELMKHYDKHIKKKPELSFQCEYCGKKFPQEYKLKRHTVRKHSSLSSMKTC